MNIILKRVGETVETRISEIVLSHSTGKSEWTRNNYYDLFFSWSEVFAKSKVSFSSITLTSLFV